MIQRNQAAKRLLEDNTIKEAFEAVKESLKDALFNATTPEDREELFRQHQAIDAAYQQLTQWAGQETLRRSQE